MEFAERVADLVGAKHTFAFNSGRAALVLILQSLVEIAGSYKNEVIIPAYTCFSVASAIVKCGLNIRQCDMDPSTLDYDYDQLESLDYSRVLAVVGCSLFGISNDWERLHALKRKQDIYLIDDAAQSFAIPYRSRFLGTLGDAGFYSFGRGKNFTTYEGGIVVTSDTGIASVMMKQYNNLPRPGVISNIATLAKLTVYSVTLNPRLYWLPDSLPFLGLGKTVFDPDFTIQRLGRLHGSLGEVLFSRIGLLNSIRQGISGSLIEGLRGQTFLEIPGVNLKEPIPYLRLPVLLSDKRMRDKAIELLRKASVVATPMYPSLIGAIPGIGEHLVDTGSYCPKAEAIPQRLLTLPTHSYVTGEDVNRIVETFGRLGQYCRN